MAGKDSSLVLSCERSASFTFNQSCLVSERIYTTALQGAPCPVNLEASLFPMRDRNSHISDISSKRNAIFFFCALFEGVFRLFGSPVWTKVENDLIHFLLSLTSHQMLTNEMYWVKIATLLDRFFLFSTLSCTNNHNLHQDSFLKGFY